MVRLNAGGSSTTSDESTTDSTDWDDTSDVEDAYEETYSGTDTDSTGSTTEDTSDSATDSTSDTTTTDTTSDSTDWDDTSDVEDAFEDTYSGTGTDSTGTTTEDTSDSITDSTSDTTTTDSTTDTTDWDDTGDVEDAFEDTYGGTDTDSTGTTTDTTTETTTETTASPTSGNTADDTYSGTYDTDTTTDGTDETTNTTTDTTTDWDDTSEVEDAYEDTYSGTGTDSTGTTTDETSDSTTEKETVEAGAMGTIGAGLTTEEGIEQTIEELEGAYDQDAAQQAIESDVDVNADEDFGDVAIGVPFTNTRLEKFLRQGSDNFRTFSEQAGGLASGGLGRLFAQPLFDEEQDIEEAIAASEADESAAAAAYGDFTTGSLQIADVFGVASTAKEAGEFVGYAGEETAEGNVDQLVDDTKQEGKQRLDALAEYAQENPAEVAGLGLGSLVGSAAIMSGAARISPRAGTAARYAIQPGEEIVGSAGFRATRRIAGEGAAQRAFPNKEPVIFSEEAAIRGARRLGELEYQPFEVRSQPSRLSQEIKSARFKVEESLRSDAPTRTSDVNTRVLDRIQQEKVAARFKAAETKQQVSNRLQSVKDDIDDFASAERGQAQLGRQRGVVESRQRPAVETEQETMLEDAQQPQVEVEAETESMAKNETGARVGTRIQPGVGPIDEQFDTLEVEQQQLKQPQQRPIRGPFGRPIGPLEIADTETKSRSETGVESIQEVEVAEMEQEAELEQLFELGKEIEQEAKREPEGKQGGFGPGIIDSMEASDVFDNPTLSPKEALEFDPIDE